MGPLLDTVLVCAVGTILLIRTELWLTNYPQLGGHGLHIAHLLWGGLAMLIAIGILVSFLGPFARQVGAVLGGLGLGFFIDELGKFVTSDNNYFYKPTAAIIYIFFIVFFLIARALQRRRELTPREYLVNALELAKDGAVRDMGRRGAAAGACPARPRGPKRSARRQDAGAAGGRSDFRRRGAVTRDQARAQRARPLL